MDYHQKYQKYKNKYMLLKQIGGGNYDVLDRQLKELINNTIKEKHVYGHKDPILLSSILKENAVVIEGVIYDINSLLIL